MTWLFLLLASLVAPCVRATSTVRCTLSNGYRFVIEVNDHWAVNGAERFLQLVDDKFYDGTALFRAVPQYIVQFGVPEDPERVNPWGRYILDDEDLRVPFEKGVVSFVGSGIHSRAYQLFITFSDLQDILGYEPWERPFGRIVEGLDDLEANIFTRYGEGPPSGSGPDLDLLHDKGYGYLRANFPRLTYLDKCKVIETNKPPPLTLQLKDQIKKEMKSIHERISLYFTAGDFRSIGYLYTQDAQIIPPDGQAIVGRENISKFYSDEHFIMGVVRHDLKTIYSAGRIGNRYFSRNVYTYALKNGDRGEGRETCIYERSKIHVQIFGEHRITDSTIDFDKYFKNEL